MRKVVAIFLFIVLVASVFPQKTLANEGNTGIFEIVIGSYGTGMGAGGGSIPPTPAITTMQTAKNLSNASQVLLSDEYDPHFADFPPSSTPFEVYLPEYGFRMGFQWNPEVCPTGVHAVVTHSYNWTYDLGFYSDEPLFLTSTQGKSWSSLAAGPNPLETGYQLYDFEGQASGQVNFYTTKDTTSPHCATLWWYHPETVLPVSITDTFVHDDVIYGRELYMFGLGFLQDGIARNQATLSVVNPDGSETEIKAASDERATWYPDVIIVPIDRFPSDRGTLVLQVGGQQVLYPYSLSP